MVDVRVRRFIEHAKAVGIGSGQPYQEAVDLNRTAKWWRDCAIHLYECMLQRQMLPSDAELDAAEECPEHFDRCGDY